jgi:Bacteriophage holin of superfamily 6 (Holin_LLH)
MDLFTNAVTQLAAELITIIGFAILSYVGIKVKTVLKRVAQKDELGIIDAITDRAVEYAEAELKGAKGIEKRDFAVEKALKMLAEKGIKLSKEEVIAGIENGVNKFKERQKQQ